MWDRDCHMPLTSSGLAVGDSGTSIPVATLRRFQKTSNKFLEILSRILPGVGDDSVGAALPWEGPSCFPRADPGEAGIAGSSAGHRERSTDR
jgi:hypothetical protein